MTDEQAAVFTAAARHFDVYILVRRTNPASLAYVGRAGFTPKRLDCKAKTADRDIHHPSRGRIECAGLVVDPTVTGAGAFASGRKYDKALEEWKTFSSRQLTNEVRSWEGQQRLTYIPRGGLYLVDLDPDSPRHGCVKFASNSLISAAKYIHGDFDLYGIVPADSPATNVRVTETRHGYAHARSPEFLDVQIFVNSRLGVPMILHGAQEAYASEHDEDELDVFHPDGRITSAESAAEIARLYATLFEGRKLFTRGGAVRVVRGKFNTPA
jgi:hypothetical protein